MPLASNRKYEIVDLTAGCQQGKTPPAGAIELGAACPRATGSEFQIAADVSAAAGPRIRQVLADADHAVPDNSYSFDTFFRAAEILACRSLTRDGQQRHAVQ